MTVQETAAILDILQTAYPRWNADKKKTLALWSQMFCDEPVELVAASVKAFIAADVQGFCPTIGQIKNTIYEIRDDSLGEVEAWGLVKRAISNGIYGSYEEYEKLPPVIQKVVGSPEQLHDWALLTDGLSTVVASNFMRAYREELRRERFSGVLPTDVKKALGAAKLLEVRNER